MQTQFEDNECWSGEESVSEILLDFASGQSLCTDSPEILTLEVVEPPRDQVDNALELNRHLHASLQRKQEEISALKEKNAQLKELAEQAERFATILDVLIPQPVKNCASRPACAHTPLTHCSSAELPEWHFTASEDSWLPSVPRNKQKRTWTDMHGVKRQLRPTDHEPFARGYDHELYSRTSDHEPFLRGSENSLYPQRSVCELYARTSGQEHFSRASENDPYPIGSIQDSYPKGSDHETYSSCSENNAFSGSFDHEPFSRGSENDPFSSCSENDSFSGGFDHEISSRNPDCGHSKKSSEHDPYSHGPSRSSGEDRVNHFVKERARKVIRATKRLKLELDLLQLSSKQLGSDSERSDQVLPKSAENLPSHKANLSQLLNTEMIQVYGAFHGLKVVMARHPVTSDLSEKGAEEAMCFKTSIRDHSTVRTSVFPHGKTFTSLTPDGSCRFLWVPDQN